jgi:hypothetical protein
LYFYEGFSLNSPVFFSTPIDKLAFQRHDIVPNIVLRGMTAVACFAISNKGRLVEISPF